MKTQEPNTSFLSVLSERRPVPVPEADEVGAQFNIMPDRYVTETFQLQPFIIATDYAEAIFDRLYRSDMEASPNHITMTVLPLLTQRLFYAWCCHRLGLRYDPRGPELLKIWPTHLAMHYPRLLRLSQNVRYRLDVALFEPVTVTRYAATISGNIGKVLRVDATGLVIVL